VHRFQAAGRECICRGAAALAPDNQSSELESPWRALFTNLHLDNDGPCKPVIAVAKHFLIAFIKSALPGIRQYSPLGLMAATLIWGSTGCSKTEKPEIVAPPPAASATAVPEPADVIGRMIAFGAGGGSERFRVSGWSKTEKDFTWTEGNSAKLALPIKMDAGQLTLRMDLVGFVHPPTLEVQNVEVFVENQKIARWEVGGTGAAFTAVIPAELTKGSRTLNIELRLPNATSPKSLGLSDDARILAVACASLELKLP